MADFRIQQSMLPRKRIPESTRKADECQEASTISKFDDSHLRCPFLAHAAPARTTVLQPSEFSLERSHSDIGIDVTQFVNDPALQYLPRRRPEAVVNPDQVVCALNGVAQQVIIRVPRNRQQQTAQPGKRPSN